MNASPAFLSTYVVEPLRFLAPVLLLIAYGITAAAYGRARRKRRAALLVILLGVLLTCLLAHIWDGFLFELEDNVVTVSPGFFFRHAEGVYTCNAMACLFWALAITATSVGACYWQRRNGTDQATNAN